MKAFPWTVPPARLGPVPLDPKPLKMPNSPGYPTTVSAARALARDIKAARAKRTPWRKIAEQLSISRIEAIRLAHSLDEVVDDILKAQTEADIATPAHQTPISAAAEI